MSIRSQDMDNFEILLRNGGHFEKISYRDPKKIFFSTFFTITQNYMLFRSEKTSTEKNLGFGPTLISGTQSILIPIQKVQDQ